MKNQMIFKLGVLVLGMTLSGWLMATDIAPPKFSVVDEFGVNVLNGQVTSSLNTVAIGGGMGISHSISGYSNHFSMDGWFGYQDKFYARTRVVIIDDRIGYDYLQVVRVHDFEGTADFKVMVNGVKQRYSNQLTSNFYYEALGDTRHTLKVVNDHLEWTKPNGTVTSFLRGNNNAWGDAQMDKVTYPNGFTLSIVSGSIVTTNTGYGIKYLFEQDTRSMDPSKINWPNTQNVPQESPIGWSTRNPKYVQAVNFAVEGCITSACNNSWPKATFTWPGGMPRSIYFGDSTFSVQDPQGGITEYYFRSFDLAYSSDGVLLAGATPNQRFSPRLIGIKPAGSSQKTISYTFKTDTVNVSNSGVLPFGPSDPNGTSIDPSRPNSLWGWEISESTLGQDEGIITGATGIHGGSYYDINRVYLGYLVSDADSNVKRVQPNLQLRGTIKTVKTLDGEIAYEESYRNFPLSFSRVAVHTGANIGGGETYHYDARGNLDSFCENAKCKTALYPSTCSNPKTCNQAIWIKDPKGNQTTFTYHELSGQVETITMPPNKNGVSAVIRNKYEQKFANYIQVQGGTKVPSLTGIWLKKSEKTCINTNTVGDACAGGAADEVVTTYEYSNDKNLLITSMDVTAADTAGVIGTRRTCYQYDNFGNRIGETQPNANCTL